LRSRDTKALTNSWKQSSEMRCPCHLHKRGLHLHVRNGARSAPRLLRRVPHQHNGRGSCPRRRHLV
jgi:hypothetical protein